jgi:DNA integrity scanning protein DisA with diadenylate cyclase activity
LRAAGYSRLSELADASDQDLSTLHGVGPTTLRILRAALDARGSSPA